MNTEYIEKGIEFVNQKEFEKALECFDKQIDLKEDSTVLGLKALALMDLNRLDEALIYISKSLELDSSNWEAWVTKAEIFKRLNKNNQALHCFDLALQINPNQSKTWTKRGFLLLNRYGQFIEAINSFNKALKLNPEDKNALYFRAEAYFALKNYKKALISCDEYLKITHLNVFDSNVYALKTKILMILNNFDDALAIINESLEFNQDDDNLYATKAMILLRAHKYDEGIKCVNKALELNPNNVIALKLKNNVLKVN